MPETPFQLVQPDEKIRCWTPECRKLHNGLPTVTFKGRRIHIFSMHCPSCSQKLADAADPRMVKRIAMVEAGA